MRGLHGCGHAERGEAAQVVGVEELRMLDPRPQPTGLPALAGGGQGIQDGAVGRIADGMHRELEARVRAPARQIEQLIVPEQRFSAPRIGERLEHPGGARAERAVGERLDGAEAKPVVAETAAQAERDDLVEPLGRERGPDAQRQACARRSAAARRRGRARAGSRGCPSRRARGPRAGRSRPPRRARSRAAPGSQRRHPTPPSRAARPWAHPRHRARRPARRRSAAARALPRTARRCGDRAPRAATGRSPQAASSASRCGPGRRRASAPSASPRRSASRSRRAAAPPRPPSTSACERVAREVEPPERERPLEEMHVRIRESRHDAAAAEIDALVGDAASGRPRARRRPRRCDRPRSRARAPGAAAGRRCARCRCAGSRG